MAEYTIDKIEYDSNVYKLQDNISGYTTNTGTVTSIGISNDTNGGLSVSGSPVTSSGTITIGHSNVLTSAQTTQAVYPIKIDKNGHISEYGSAVTIPSYTATSPIDITSGVISHEASGVTAGTYVPSHPSKSYTYFPSITVDSTGHITSASNTGFSFECIGGTDITPCFISKTAYSKTVRSSLTTAANSSYILTAGNTSKTISISDIYGDGSYYFKVDDVICRDKTTYEQLICDWKTGTFTGYDNHGSLTLYVTIAEPYTHDILIDPIISYGNSTGM